MSTPETTVTPVPTETTNIKDLPVIPAVVDNGSNVKDDTPAKILEGVNALCNTCLYVLTKGMYPGADAHLVHQAKEFVKEIKADVNRKQTDLANGKAVDLGQDVKSDIGQVVKES